MFIPQSSERLLEEHKLSTRRKALELMRSEYGQHLASYDKFFQAIQSTDAKKDILWERYDSKVKRTINLTSDCDDLIYAACVALAQHVQLKSDKCQVLFISSCRSQLHQTYRRMIQIANKLSIEDEIRISGFNPHFANIGQDLKTIFPFHGNKMISKEETDKWLCPHVLMNDPRGMYSLITQPDVISITTGVSLIIVDCTFSMEYSEIAPIVEAIRRNSHCEQRFVFLCHSMTRDTAMIADRCCRDSDPILVETIQPSVLTCRPASTIEPGPTNVPVLGATLCMNLAINCCLSKQYGIPIELRCIVYSYVVDVINDDNIHTITKAWYDAEDELSLTQLTLQYGHISYWNTSKVTNMKELFKGYSNFNENIQQWDVSNVIDMNSMFQYAYMFNQPINHWNVNKVTNMNYLFDSALSFNQCINNWNVSNVITMCGMFKNCCNFNSSLSNWNVINVIDMSEMFAMNRKFNNDSLCNWQVDNVTTMMEMFASAFNFNGNISLWNVYNVKNMIEVFFNACKFNQSLINWKFRDESCVDGMFYGSAMDSLNYPIVENEDKRLRMLAPCALDFDNFGYLEGRW